MTPIRLAIAAALAAASLSSPVASAATVPVNIGSQYTDLWWNPQENGWGMNVVQQGETAFITLFVYGPDDKPTWYVASAAQVFAVDSERQSGLPRHALQDDGALARRAVRLHEGRASSPWASW